MSRATETDELDLLINNAQDFYSQYPRHVLAIGMARLLQYRLVHRELLDVVLEQSERTPLRIFIDALNDRKKRHAENDNFND